MAGTNPPRFLVVDVGNSRVKWGLCSDGALQAFASLPPDNESSWQEQLKQWRIAESYAWLLSGVHPARRDRLGAWLTSQGHRVVPLLSYRQLHLDVSLQYPDRAGIDRLLNAVAVNSRRPPGTAAVIVDAGSAVTVDLLDGEGRFRGGAILPGLRLMAQSLHTYTALLPLVEITRIPSALGDSTTTALEAGVYYAVAGGIERLIRELTSGQDKDNPAVFFGGGDASLLQPALARASQVWPTMTLEGLRLAAENLL